MCEFAIQTNIIDTYLWSPSFGRDVAKEPVNPTPTTGKPTEEKETTYVRKCISSQ